MYKPMADLEKVINSPEQRSGEFWQLASSIILDHPSLLREKISDDGEERYLITPEFVPTQAQEFRDFARYYGTKKVNPVTPANKDEENVLNQRYSIAAHVNPRGGYKPNMPLYLIINGNTTSPPLKFDRQTSRLMVLDGSYSAIEDSDQTIDKILKFLDQCMDAKQQSVDSERQAERDSHRTRRRVMVGIIAGMLAVSAGVGSLVKWRHDLAEEQRRARKIYDAQNITIDSPGVTAPGLSFVQSDPDFFTKFDTPKPAKHDSLAHPRRFNILEGTCVTVATISPTEEQVHVTTATTKEQIYVVGNSEGVIQVCALETPNDTSEESEFRFATAVQVTPRRPA